MKVTHFILLAALVASASGTLGYFLYHHSPPSHELTALSFFSTEDFQPTGSQKTRRPDFSLLDLQGKLRSNSEWDGKVVIVNFWATWCPPCLQEIPDFIDLQEQYAKRGLQFIGIAIDDPDKVQRFVNNQGINYPVFVGNQQPIEIATKFGNRIGALPFTVIINREGDIVFRQIGGMDKQKTKQVILSLL